MENGEPNPLPASVYVNFLRLAYNQSEFFLAFGQVGQDGAAAHLLSSLVTTPAHARAMLDALEQAVKQYEDRHGPIPQAAPPRSAARPPQGAAPGKRRTTG